MATPEKHRAGSEMVKLTFLVPLDWREALIEAAHIQRISVADLLRIVLRGFLRERYTPEQQRELGIS